MWGHTCTGFQHFASSHQRPLGMMRRYEREAAEWRPHSHWETLTKSGDSCLMGREMTSWRRGIRRRRGNISHLFSLIAISLYPHLLILIGQHLSHRPIRDLGLCDHKQVELRWFTAQSTNNRQEEHLLWERCLVWLWSTFACFCQIGWEVKRGRGEHLMMNRKTTSTSTGASSQIMNTLPKKRGKLGKTFTMMFLLNPSSHFHQHSRERRCLKTSTAS